MLDSGTNRTHLRCLEHRSCASSASSKCTSFFCSCAPQRIYCFFTVLTSSGARSPQREKQSAYVVLTQALGKSVHGGNSSLKGIRIGILFQVRGLWSSMTSFSLCCDLGGCGISRPLPKSELPDRNNRTRTDGSENAAWPGPHQGVKPRLDLLVE